MDENISIKLSGVNKWTLRPLHQRHRFARNESLNSLLEFIHLLKKVDKLFGTLEAARSVDAEVVPALQDVSLEVSKGSAVAVVDPDGIGKTALIQVIGQAALVNGGSVLIKKRVVNLGVLTSLIMGNYTARRNLYLLGDLLGFSRAELDRALPETISLAGAQSIIDLPLRRIGARPFADLALAMVCCLAPDIIAAEELLPTLSPSLRSKLIERYRANLADGQTLVFSAKKLDTILDLSTHLLLIENGKLLAFGPSQEVMDSHGDWVADSVEAAAKLAVNQLIIEDEEDLDEAGLFGDETGADLLGDDAHLELGTDHDIEKIDERVVPAQEPAANKLRKSNFEQIGGLAYETRIVEACRIVERESGSIMFDSAGEPLERIQVGCGKSKYIDTDEAISIQFHLETTEPNLRLLPMLDVFAKDLPAVRAVAPDYFEAPGQSRVRVRFDFPPNLFAERFYILNAAAVVQKIGSPATDLCIWRDLDCFDGGRFDPVSKQQLPPSEHKVDGRMARPLVESKADWRTEAVPQSELLEIRSFALHNQQGEQFLSEEADEEPLLEARIDEALQLSMVAQTYRPDVVLESVIELWIDRYFAARIRSHEPLVVAEPRQVRLESQIPPQLLMDHRYRLRLGVKAIERATLEQQVRYHPIEPTISVLAGDPGDSTSRLFACGASPITSLSLPCAMEIVASGDRAKPQDFS